MIVFFKVVCCGRTVDARMIDLEDHPDLEFYNIVPDGYTLVSVRVCTTDAYNSRVPAIVDQFEKAGFIHKLAKNFQFFLVNVDDVPVEGGTTQADAVEEAAHPIVKAFFGGQREREALQIYEYVEPYASTSKCDDKTFNHVTRLWKQAELGFDRGDGVHGTGARRRSGSSSHCRICPRFRCTCSSDSPGCRYLDRARESRQAAAATPWVVCRPNEHH